MVTATSKLIYQQSNIKWQFSMWGITTNNVKKPFYSVNETKIEPSHELLTKYITSSVTLRGQLLFPSSIIRSDECRYTRTWCFHGEKLHDVGSQLLVSHPPWFNSRNTPLLTEWTDNILQAFHVQSIQHVRFNILGSRLLIKSIW
jgi:hypothetical protein